MDTAQASREVESLKESVASNNLQQATRTLQSLKKHIASSRSLPPFLEHSPTQQQEVSLARDALEHGVLLATKLNDDDLFERTFAQLKPFYTTARHLAPESPNELLLAGLNLLRLLVQKRVSDFHTEVELIPQSAQFSPYIHHALEIERCLTEGAYSKVLSARDSAPSEVFKPLIDRLESTMQAEVASCCEASYEWLPTSRAKALLKLDGDAALQNVAAERGWRVENGCVMFAPADYNASMNGDAGNASGEQEKKQQVPASELVNQTLLYARELERIV